MQQEAVLPIGTIIREHYVVEKLLSKGKGDPVYLVRDRWATQDLFVLKERIDLDKQERDRFVFEGVVLKQLHHPALQYVYRVFEENSRHRVYMLMQYISGPNLEMMRRHWPNQSFSLPLMLSIVTPVVDAITYLHSQHDPVIHRDINPSNIVVPGNKRAVLVNFGIYRADHPNTITSTSCQCSPGYGAPEQYRGETDPLTDLYALAATFYTVLTGIVPPDARDRIAQLVNRGVDPLVRADEVIPFVPATVAEAIHRAMSMTSDERFPSVAEFWQALQAPSSSPSIESVEPIEPDTDDKDVGARFIAPQRWGGAYPETNTPNSPALSTPNETAKELKEPTQPSVPEWSSQQAPMRTLAATPYQGLVRGAIVGAINRIPVNRRLRIQLSTWRSRGPAALLLLVFVLALLLSIGAILWSRTVGHSSGAVTSHSVIVHKATPTPIVSSTPEGVYKGTIHDILANKSASMSLTGIYLRPGDISGYLSVGPGLRGSGPFKGTVNIARHIQFVVMDGAGRAIFSFEGNVQPAGNIAGSYCALNQNGQCSGDYGLWSVAPVSA